MVKSANTAMAGGCGTGWTGFGTKAATLARLRPLVKYSFIGAQVCFAATAWPRRRAALLGLIRQRFGAVRLAVRSSSRIEDQHGGSNAGQFVSVIDVDGGEENSLCDAIDAVIDSFHGNTGDQVLIQAMVRDVVAAGVAFTCTFHGAPYYVINYDDRSGRTDTVTSGRAARPSVCVLHRGLGDVPADAHPSMRDVLRAVRELENLIGSNALDIEFAVDRTGNVHVLQVRAVAVASAVRSVLYDEAEKNLVAAQRGFQRHQKSLPGVFGSRTIFGAMPDWNPAEMIGMTPRRLALSLYRYLITDAICATERVAMGYHDIRPNPLLVEICGHPYIDLRASFSSFIPASVSDDLAARLVEFYVTKLEEQPELHDKVEFEVALTALSFDFQQRSAVLRQAGFGVADIDALRHGLFAVTQCVVAQVAAQQTRLAELTTRYEQRIAGSAPSLPRALQILQDCRSLGTPAFAQLARAAFVAVGFLRSGVARDLIRPEERDGFLRSLNSGAKQMGRAAARVRRGELAWERFLAIYGHLRPGTYDLSVPSYSEAAEVYLRPMVDNADLESLEDLPFEFSQSARHAFRLVLRELALPDDVDAFILFLRRAIEGRESAKFTFTRNLSRALSDLSVAGAAYGLTTAQIAQLEIDHLFDLDHGAGSGDPRQWLVERAAAGEQLHEIAQFVELPPLIVNPEQLLSFVYSPTVPNFIGREPVLAPVVEIGANSCHSGDVTGKIALLTHGDPGYDWLFAMGIVGLVTLYGGINSHMAIRAAELGIPAALGVGQALFAQCRTARMLRIECLTRQIEAIG